VFPISPEQIIQDMLAFQQKLGQGLTTLTKLEDFAVGSTPKEAVYHEDKLVLYRYKSMVKNPNPVPILIVYALVNRPYMLDLQPDRSLIRHLLSQGQDVYLIDWGYPDVTDRYLTLADYIHGYIHRCIKAVCKRHGISKINLLGVCQGGTLSLCYSAIYPERVKSLITMVTPVDFHTPDNLLSHWVAKLDIDLLVDTLGNIPGELLNWTFLSMKPFKLTGQKYLDMLDNLTDTESAAYFLRMEKWIFDSPDQAGEAFREFIKLFFQQNSLVKAKLCIGEHPVDLRHLTMPILNIYAEQDHLVPPAATKALKRLVGTDNYTEVAFNGGHIGIYVSSRAGKQVPTAITEWLESTDLDEK
jgi:polyhydroxyalkanoate synthase subunit PhaC